MPCSWKLLIVIKFGSSLKEKYISSCINKFMKATELQNFYMLTCDAIFMLSCLVNLWNTFSGVEVLVHGFVAPCFSKISVNFFLLISVSDCHLMNKYIYLLLFKYRKRREFRAILVTSFTQKWKEIK